MDQSEQESDGSAVDNKEKTRVNKMRRKAARQGYTLRKTRRVDRDAADYGTFSLVPEKGKPRTFASIDEVEAFLTRQYAD